jgi:hypothetical protein
VTDLNRPLLGEPNAPCRACGSPLAADQRYCLQCGTRRAEARLPFLDILAQQIGQDPARTTATTTTTGPQRGLLGRVSANTAAVAGVACLVLALGVGVLIGGLGHDDNATAAPPAQVITVGGVAAAPDASTAAPAATEAAPADTSATDAATARRAARRHRAAASAADSRATDSTVRSLDRTSGSDYAKRSARLPKQLGTGGRAPPKDTSGKAIGGGSDVESIG